MTKPLRVVITGASSGIGAEVARQYAVLGAHLALVARREELLAEVARDCRALGCADVVAIPCDVGRKDEVKTAASKAVAALGGIDRAYLNAGGYGPEEVAKRSLEWSAEGFTARAAEDIMRANYFGTVYWLEEVLRVMRSTTGGTIAVTGAQAADRGYPLHGPYAAAKAANRALVEALRADAKRFGITMCLIEPGCVESELTENHCCDEMPFIRPTWQAVEQFIAGVERGQAVIRWPMISSVTSRLATWVPRAAFDYWATRKLRPR